MEHKFCPWKKQHTQFNGRYPLPYQVQMSYQRWQSLFFIFYCSTILVTKFCMSNFWAYLPRSFEKLDQMKVTCAQAYNSSTVQGRSIFNLETTKVLRFWCPSFLLTYYAQKMNSASLHNNFTMIPWPQAVNHILVTKNWMSSWVDNSHQPTIWLCKYLLQSFLIIRSGCRGSLLGSDTEIIVIIYTT